MIHTAYWRPLPKRQLLHDLRRYFDYHPPATSEEIRAGLGYAPIVRFTRGSQWLEVYARE